MRKFFLFIFFLFLAAAVQFILTGLDKTFGIDLFFILVLFWSYFRNWREAILAGFFCGILKDIYFSPLFGVNAFSLCLTAILINEVRRRIYQQNFIFFALISGIFFLVYNLIFSFWMAVFFGFSPGYTFNLSFLYSLLYTSGICGLIFFTGETMGKKEVML